MHKNSQSDEISIEPFLSGHKVSVLFLLFLVYTFSFIDRQILVILAEPIKAEFGLKDWQLGFLTGTAFALFYATLGIPVARLADRWHRVNVIAISLTLWSAMTALCAATNNFVQLAAARIGVGVGEAGGSPPAVSVLSSYFHRKQRSTAMGIYALGPTVGILIGFVVGGWVNELYGWRAALLVVSIPGIFLAALVKFIIKEPDRDTRGLPSTESIPPIGRSLVILFDIKTFRRVNVAVTAGAFTVYGFLAWMPVYLIRHFGLSTGEVGTKLGLIAGFAGSIGVFLGGYIADRLSKHDNRWQMRLPAVTTLTILPLMLLVLNADTANAAMLLLVPTYVLVLAHTGPTWAILQSVSPQNMRAMAAAIALFLINLIGLGLGPQLVGILSDVLRSDTETGGLRTAISVVGTGSLVASCYYYLASKSVQHDLEKPESS